MTTPLKIRATFLRMYPIGRYEMPLYAVTCVLGDLAPMKCSQVTLDATSASSRAHLLTCVADRLCGAVLGLPALGMPEAVADGYTWDVGVELDV